MNSLHPVSEFPSILYTDENVEATKPRHTQPEKTPGFKRRLQRGLARTAIGVTIGTTAFIGAATGALQHDIQQGREAVADSQPSMGLVYEPTDQAFEDAATITLTGLGTRSATTSAKKLEAHAETGHVFALEYSNQTIDIDELTNTVVEGLEAQGEASGTPVKYVNFDGYSMGGIVLLAVAANIHENIPELDVTLVSLNSTPVGEDSLSPRSSKAMGILGNAINVCHNYIKLCDGLEYSHTAQRVTEVAIRYANYYNPETHGFNRTEFKKTIDYVDRRLARPTTASPVLVYSQAGVVEGASDELLKGAQKEFLLQHGVEQSIEVLSETKPNKPPVSVFYTMSENPREDKVVNVTYSSQALRIIANKYDANLEVVAMPVGHANVNTQEKPYNEFIEKHVNPRITLAIEENKTTENATTVLALQGNLERHG